MPFELFPFPGKDSTLLRVLHLLFLSFSFAHFPGLRKQEHQFFHQHLLPAAYQRSQASDSSTPVSNATALSWNGENCCISALVPILRGLYSVIIRSIIILPSTAKISCFYLCSLIHFRTLLCRKLTFHSDLHIALRDVLHFSSAHYSLWQLQRNSQRKFESVNTMLHRNTKVSLPIQILSSQE